jgi:hypothetical protein
MSLSHAPPDSQRYGNYQYNRRSCKHIKVSKHIAQVLNPLTSFHLYIAKLTLGLMYF